MNILFDLDGTLTDPYEGITQSIVHALETLGKEAPEPKELKWCIGPPLQNSFAKLLGSNDEQLAEKAIEIYRERYSTIGLFENEVYEGIHELLKSLKADGHILYVATAKPTVYSEQIISRFDLQQYFIKVYGSELDGTRTNKADLIAHIIKCEALDPTETLMVGDRQYDMLGANANDLSSVGVLWGYGTLEELQSSGAQNHISHPDELKELIKTL
jgi:phosphoglycolate phosphatase